MLDVKFIYENAEVVKSAIKNKGEKNANVDLICSLYKERKEIQGNVDNLRRELNIATEKIAVQKRQGKLDENIIIQNRQLGDKINELEGRFRKINSKLNEQLIWVPNIPAKDVPIGKNSQDTIEVKHWGERKNFDFKPKPHWEIGQTLGIVDFERASKLAGSNFLLLKGTGARLERALINFMLDLHTQRHHYIEIFPPFLSTRSPMFNTGQLPKLETDMYLLPDDDLFLIPTAEVPVTNIHLGEILNYEDLPLYYASYTACFRREAGAYGKETRGMIRVHQFNKVELVKLTHPESSFDELEKLLRDAEEVIQLLGLEYRVVKLCTGELSFASAKTYDIEVWAPGVGMWLEVSSCSNFTDFQARRANIRFRDKDGKLKFVHTLNGSGVALPRTMIAILENYQQKDGSIKIPDAICPYMNGMRVITGY